MWGTSDSDDNDDYDDDDEDDDDDDNDDDDDLFTVHLHPDACAADYRCVLGVRPLLLRPLARPHHHQAQLRQGIRTGEQSFIFIFWGGGIITSDGVNSIILY